MYLKFYFTLEWSISWIKKKKNSRLSFVFAKHFWYLLLLVRRLVKWKLLSRVWFFVTPWTVARQASLSVEFSRKEYWSGLLFPSPVDIPNPRIEPRSHALQADSLPCEPPGKLHLSIPITCFLSVHLLIWSQGLLRHRTLLMFHEEIQPSIVKPGSCQCRWHRFNPWAGTIPWRRKWQLTPVFLSRKFHGQRSLAGYSPWGHKESDTTEQLTPSIDRYGASQVVQW